MSSGFTSASHTSARDASMMMSALATSGSSPAEVTLSVAADIASPLPAARNLRALLAGLGQPNRDRLLAALHARVAALARLERTALGPPHCTRDRLVRRAPVTTLSGGCPAHDFTSIDNLVTARIAASGCCPTT